MTVRTALGFALVAALTWAGCAVPAPAPSLSSSAADPAAPSAAVVPEAAPPPLPAAAPEAVSPMKGLEDEVFRLAQLRESEGADYKRRLLSVEKERDAAVAEVVRTRARLQGMASAAEAGAMFAEARVLVDRMEEDSFSTLAREQLKTAKRRLSEGKTELDKGNPGGAAYLFDQLSNLYEAFRKGSPRQLLVVTASVDLRASPGAGGKVTGSLLRNDPVEGVARAEGWVQVRGVAGRKGWIPWEAVR